MESIILVLTFVTSTTALKCNVFWDDGIALTSKGCDTDLSKYCITFSGKYADSNGNKDKDTIQACESDSQVQAIEHLGNFKCEIPGSRSLKISVGSVSLDGELYCCNADNCNAVPETKSTLPLYILWYVLAGILLLIIICLIIIITKHKQIRKKRKFLYAQQARAQEDIKNKLEMSPIESKLSHDNRLQMQLDAKNVLVDFNFIIGKGSHATVYKALIKGESKYHILQKRLKTSSYQNCTAAFKLPTTFDVDEIESFVRELDALITIGSHPHIIAFLGWSIYHETVALVTELASQNLLSYVKSFRDLQTLPYKQILSILWQITQALEHLAKFSLVHRDVACRNILLTETFTAKLADFGLCCHCDESFTYKASLQKKFPLKWLSIEALVDRIFSEKSDVWSFGILCYEVFTYGAVPFPAMSNVEMLEFLQTGHRLEKPEAAPEDMHDLMLKCWHKEPDSRPNFLEIENILRDMLEKETQDYGYLTLNLKTES